MAAAPIPTGLPQQLSERLAELSTGADGESGVIDVPVEILIELPLEDLRRLGIDASAIFREPAGGNRGRAGYTVTGTRAIQLLLAQLLRGGLLESALAEFMNDVINTSFLDAEPDFTPAAERDIRNLPVFTITRDHLASDAVSAEMKTCPICRDAFEEGRRVLRLPCRHLFCEECLRPWLEKSRTCPLCREEITDILPTGEKQPVQGILSMSAAEDVAEQDTMSDRTSTMSSTVLAPALHYSWPAYTLDAYSTPIDASPPSLSYYDPGPYLSGHVQVPSPYVFGGQYGGLSLPSVVAHQQPVLHFSSSPPVTYTSTVYASFLVLDPFSASVTHTQYY
eukprot:EG_transcript_11135